MDMLALHLSPRKNGNSAIMLEEFLRGARDSGAEAAVFSAADHDIQPCRGCGACEKTGDCVIEDDDMRELYPLLTQTQMIVIATSLFFYSVPGRGKNLIDRVQPLWGRRYALGHTDLIRPQARGFLLALGATKGQDLFVPVNLTVKYFFDSIGFPRRFDWLGFRLVEGPGDMARHADYMEQVYQAGRGFGLARPAANP